MKLHSTNTRFAWIAIVFTMLSCGVPQARTSTKQTQPTDQTTSPSAADSNSQVSNPPAQSSDDNEADTQPDELSSPTDSPQQSDDESMTVIPPTVILTPFPGPTEAPMPLPEPTLAPLPVDDDVDSPWGRVEMEHEMVVPQNARIITVNTTEDLVTTQGNRNQISLRQAFMIADQHPRLDYIIKLESGQEYILTIAGGASEKLGRTGDLNLNNRQGVVIVTTTGVEKATINANRLSHVISTRGSALTLHNLVLRGADYPFYGGGVAVSEQSLLKIYDSEVTDNQSLNDGAGIFAKDSSVYLYRTRVHGNRVYATDIESDGGGVSLWRSDMVAVFSVFDHNRVLNGAGGGLHNTNGSTLILVNCSIFSNYAKDMGGGIMNYTTETYANSNLRLVNTSVHNNEGGGITLYGGEHLIQNSTIAENFYTEAKSGFIPGAGIHIRRAYNGLTGRLVLQNSLVVNNRRGDVNKDVTEVAGEGDIIGDGFNLLGEIGRLTNAASSDATLGTGSDIVINRVEPLSTLFIDDMEIISFMPNSRAKDAGSIELVPADFCDIDGDGNYQEKLPVDIRGNEYPRVKGEHVDIGALEY